MDRLRRGLDPPSDRPVKRGRGRPSCLDVIADDYGVQTEEERAALFDTLHQILYNDDPDAVIQHLIGRLPDENALGDAIMRLHIKEAGPSALRRLKEWGGPGLRPRVPCWRRAD
ncbi:MAG: hypothetical protein ACOYXN_11135 [Acidobacteriota bacterium]